MGWEACKVAAGAPLVEVRLQREREGRKVGNGVSEEVDGCEGEEVALWDVSREEICKQLSN
jgi:hypothetical protein